MKMADQKKLLEPKISAPREIKKSQVDVAQPNGADKAALKESGKEQASKKATETSCCILI